MEEKKCGCGAKATNELPTADGHYFLCDDCYEHWQDYAEPVEE